MGNSKSIALAAAARKRPAAGRTVGLDGDAYDDLAAAAKTEGVALTTIASIAVLEGLEAARRIVRQAKKAVQETEA